MHKYCNGTKSNNFFHKFKAWIFNFFHLTPKTNLISEQSEKNDITTEKSKNGINQINIFEEYRLKNERYQYLLDLQVKYKSKEILEQDLIEEDRIDLEKLYIQQNSELKRKIIEYEKKIVKFSN